MGASSAPIVAQVSTKGAAVSARRPLPSGLTASKDRFVPKRTNRPEHRRSAAALTQNPLHAKRPVTLLQHPHAGRNQLEPLLHLVR